MKTKRTSSGLALLGLSTILAGAAQLDFRFVMQQYGLSAAEPNGILASLTDAHALLLAAGIVLYGISMVTWIFVLNRFDVSLAYPLMSISYVLVFLFAVNLPYFDETVSLRKIVAIALVVAGVAILSSEKRAAPVKTSPARSSDLASTA